MFGDPSPSYLGYSAPQPDPQMRVSTSLEDQARGVNRGRGIEVHDASARPTGPNKFMTNEPTKSQPNFPEQRATPAPTQTMADKLTRHLVETSANSEMVFLFGFEVPQNVAVQVVSQSDDINFIIKTLAKLEMMIARGELVTVSTQVPPPELITSLMFAEVVKPGFLYADVPTQVTTLQEMQKQLMKSVRDQQEAANRAREQQQQQNANQSAYINNTVNANANFVPGVNSANAPVKKSLLTTQNIAIAAGILIVGSLLFRGGADD